MNKAYFQEREKLRNNKQRSNQTDHSKSIGHTDDTDIDFDIMSKAVEYLIDGIDATKIDQRGA